MLEESPQRQSGPEVLSAIVVGDVRVGKTTLVRKCCGIPIQGKMIPTIGVQFGSAVIEMPNRQYLIKFWDLSGQKKYQNSFSTYMQRSNIAIVVFDLTNYESYHNAKEWIMEIKQKFEEIHILLFGNKKDIFQRNPKSTLFVPAKAINKFVEETGIIYEQGCALSDNKFTQGIKKIIQKYFMPNQIILEGADEAKKCGCFC